jgi:hypothetical protein
VPFLKERLKDMGREQFLKIYYFNPDAIFGSQKSFEFVKEVLNENEGFIPKK